VCEGLRKLQLATKASTMQIDITYEVAGNLQATGSHELLASAHLLHQPVNDHICQGDVKVGKSSVIALCTLGHLEL
jgi:hypothetical protein